MSGCSARGRSSAQLRGRLDFAAVLQAVFRVLLQSQAAAWLPQDLRRTALLRSLLQRTEEKAPMVTPMHSRHKPIGELTAFAVGTGP